jgi:NADPH-dependent 2,4-dienoyl-CoA reductase/sulfur reductase-like enzyme
MPNQPEAEDALAARVGRRRFLLATAGLGVAARALPRPAFAAGAFRNLDEVEDGATLEADIAVVGAGAAGITLARALAGRRSRMLLIESGGLDLDGPTQELSTATSWACPTSR